MDRSFLVARFLYQAGFAVVMATLLGSFLVSTEDAGVGPSTWLPIMIFGFALPSLALAVPAHIVSSAIASGRFLMLVSLALGVAAVAFVVGRIVFSWDRIFIITISCVMGSVGQLGQSIWGRLWLPGAFGEASKSRWSREGLLTWGGWTTGLIVTPLLSVGGSPHVALGLGAALFWVSGWLVHTAPRRISSANWLSNRSALRLFAAIENACRSSHSRRILFRVFSFAGASLSLISFVPGGWLRDRGQPFEDVTLLSGLAVLLALAGGLGMAALPRVRRWVRAAPGASLLAICLALPASALGMTMTPWILYLPLGVIFGGGVGLVLEAASRQLQSALGSAYFSESAVLMSVLGGAGGVFFGGCFWAGQVIGGQGWVLFGIQALLFASFAIGWRREWIDQAKSPAGADVFDPWYPGRFPAVSGAVPDDSCLVAVAYEVAAENREAFERAIQDLAHLRQKQGALFWTLIESSENSEILKEQFIVESHLAFREAIRNETEAEREIKQRVFDLNRWDSLPCESRHRLLEA